MPVLHRPRRRPEFERAGAVKLDHKPARLGVEPPGCGRQGLSVPGHLGLGSEDHPLLAMGPVARGHGPDGRPGRLTGRCSSVNAS